MTETEREQFQSETRVESGMATSKLSHDAIDRVDRGAHNLGGNTIGIKKLASDKHKSKCADTDVCHNVSDNNLR